MFAVEINNVSKTYLKASRPAVQDVQLQISPGERIGLIGANGSGKTTLLRLLMNFVLLDLFRNDRKAWKTLLPGNCCKSPPKCMV
jgi:ATPase subunit of ABC transporter with duplicated ATPase domains